MSNCKNISEYNVFTLIEQRKWTNSVVSWHIHLIPIRSFSSYLTAKAISITMTNLIVLRREKSIFVQRKIENP